MIGMLVAGERVPISWLLVGAWEELHELKSSIITMKTIIGIDFRSIFYL
jgi:uncharacterized membrane protein YccF (DUF307 family)